MSMNDLPPPPPSDPLGAPTPSRAVAGVPVASKISAAGQLKAPAITLLVFASIGALLALANLVFAIVVTPERMQEWLSQLIPNAQPNAFAGAGGSQGFNILTSALFLGLNGFIIFGASRAMRVQSWPIAFAATIAAMVNVGSCCCVVTLPIGIWLLVVLLKPDVKGAFDNV